VKQGSGVVLTLSTSGSQMSGQGFLGYGVTCGAIETFSRILTGAHARTPRLGRLPTLAEVADYAAFVASDPAGAMTGAIANLSAALLVD